MPFGLRLLDCLLHAGAQVHLLYSPAAQVVAKQECDLTLPTQPREAMRMLGERYGARAGQLNVYCARGLVCAGGVRLESRRRDGHLSLQHGDARRDRGRARRQPDRARRRRDAEGAPAAGARAARDAAVRDPPREHAEARARRRGDPAARAGLLHAPAVGRRHRRLRRRARARSSRRRARARAAVGRGSHRRAAAGSTA